MRFNLIILLSVIVCSILITTGCGSTPDDINPSVNKNGSVYEDTDDTDGKLIFERSLELEYANNFTVDFYKGGYIIFKSTASEQEYLIVPENKSVPADIAEEVKILYAPLNNLYIDSSAMVSLISSFDGGLDFLKVVTTETVIAEEFFRIVSEADYIFYMNYYTKFTSMEEFIEFNEIHQELKAVQNKKIWYTSPDFSQKANALGDIIADMNKILASGENIDTDYLIYMK